MARDSKKDRRRFLTDAGKYGALVVGGLATRAEVGGAQDAVNGLEDIRPAREQSMQLRVFGFVQRAHGLTKAEIRRKSHLALGGYYSAVFQEAIKINDNRSQLIHIENFVTDGAFGAEGQMQCPPFVNRDLVCEFSYGIGDTKVGNMAGLTDVPLPTQGQTAQRRRAALPDYTDDKTNVDVVARQVLGEGTRPLSPSGRVEKAMHFIKMAPNATRAEQVKVWQTLHAAALAETPALADGVRGYEVLQHMEDMPTKQSARCGGDLPVADLVAAYWFKSKYASSMFPSYVRAWRKADKQNNVDVGASFFVFVEEVAVWTNTSFVG